jgi:hypothetical protein
MTPAPRRLFWYTLPVLIVFIVVVAVVLLGGDGGQNTYNLF